MPNTIGNYHIIREIGRGRISVVNLVKDKYNQQFALKVLLPIGQDNNAINLIKREADISSRLIHPNIVTVLAYKDLKSDMTRYHCILMEYIKGGDLSERMKKGPLSLGSALYIAWSICNALEYSHSKNVVHRDLKPQNILLGENNIVKVADFGLASAASTTITTLSSAKGTPLYLSPEQAEDDKPDERSDIYSLGAILYHMLTGRAPFEGDNQVSIMRRHVDEAPLLVSEWRDDIPVRLDALVNKALSKKPSRRYQSAKEMREAIEEIASENGIELTKPIQTPVGRRFWKTYFGWPIQRRRDLVTNIAASLIFVILAFILVKLFPILEPVFAPSPPSMIPATSIGVATSPTPTGVVLITTYDSSKEVETTRVFIEANSTNTPTPTLTPHLTTTPSFTDLIAFASEKDGDMDIWVMNTASINEEEWQQLTFNEYPDGNPVWSPDGENIAFLSSSPPNISSPKVFIIRLDEGCQSQLTYTAFAKSPLWSPDGRYISYVVSSEGNDDIGIIDIRTFPLSCTNVISATDDITPPPEPTLIASKPGDYESYVSWAPEPFWGRIVYSLGDPIKKNRDIYTLDFNSSFEPTSRLLIGDDEFNDIFPEYSPDGESVAFISDRSSNTNDIYIFNINGIDPPLQLTNTGESKSHLRWSPTGKTIAFYSRANENSKLCVIDVSLFNGTNPSIPFCLSENVFPDSWPVWSTDGKKMVFVSEVDGDLEIFMINSDGTSIVQLTDNTWDDRDPSWQPKPSFKSSGELHPHLKTFSLSFIPVFLLIVPILLTLDLKTIE